MKWGEFKAMLAGLDYQTPLGRIVSARAEDDKDVLKHFTKEQHRIRNEWRSRNAKKVTEEGMQEMLEALKQGFLSMSING